MPIRQPLKTTIHTDDFLDHAFSFPVESVLSPQQGSGKLTISTSAGYLLTTSPDHEPTPEQTLDHVLQPDGNRVARGMVTLVANDESMEESTVIIRNPSGETVILTVDPTPETALSVPQPALRVSASELTFAKTPVGKPAFLIFSVAQQNADTPVTITTDAPDSFQLACDSRPAFTPSLTLTPSVTGTYVHVRFAPLKAGKTEAFLFVEAAYAKQVITLTGRGVGLLPKVRNASPATAAPSQPARPVSLWQGILLTTVLVAALSAMAYNFRCQLMPSLCEETAKPGAAAERPHVVAPAPSSAADAISAKQKSPSAVKSASGRVSDERANPASVEGAANSASTASQADDAPAQNPISNPVEQPASSPATGNLTGTPSASTRKTSGRQSETPLRRSAEKPRVEKQPESVATPSAESELEKELNTKKPRNQQ